ncbi:DUF4259 domain-containing protein [Pseudoduganella namucuonensis]|uniref:DUF4259 domain-containing protein n=1 Tax=Pseudoduganella namucuonensis TaxID=1035707 RepID=A0A1I7M2I5_9BURK|nr:DUF4259 domain-containing protein [Pseudoduganella namucuonensis]SFV16171.1 protein of unknown function [Pseudoduganella namucuonensis]
MGTWAIDAFGNDIALDWAEDLQESKDLYFIENTLNNVLSADSAAYLEAPFAAEGLAAIEVLARLQGQPGEAEEGIDAWVDEVRAKFKRRPDLVEKAQRAIDHILSDKSELRELWADGDDYDSWRAAVEALRTRVSA